MGNLLADFCINLLYFEKKELILQRKGGDEPSLNKEETNQQRK
jgi:hypothetical protein